MKGRRYLKSPLAVISWGLVLLWMAVIFYLSAQVADESSQLSSGITEVVGNTIQRILPFKFDSEHLHFLIRKGAHFTAYFILGLLTINAFRVSGLNRKQDIQTALLVCILYAISDEIHQLYVPGRSGQVTDVLIDSAGAVTGLGVYQVIRWYFK
ncbi:VanZ family protein [Haloplasma contractile]|uniref:VanZ family protein n=1 Tax=Haloplasma contractile SSD-17B TaxID=1033810 RepID=F7PW67_9MOLU|nr:VanZ family protein [Haloplasma contractile]ERJ11273.1 VanZ family protein [Haloplasma contractile SSD-17B]